jgi:hypothetical protein
MLALFVCCRMGFVLAHTASTSPGRHGSEERAAPGEHAEVRGGGSGGGESRERRIQEIIGRTNVMLSALKMERNSNVIPLGAMRDFGTCRHRAILFKMLAGRVSPKALHARARARTHTHTHQRVQDRVRQTCPSHSLTIWMLLVCAGTHLHKLVFSRCACVTGSLMIYIDVAHVTTHIDKLCSSKALQLVFFTMCMRDRFHASLFAEAEEDPYTHGSLSSSLAPNTSSNSSAGPA